MSKKKPCGLDYCPQEEIIGAYASCSACAWGNDSDDESKEEMMIYRLDYFMYGKWITWGFYEDADEAQDDAFEHQRVYGSEDVRIVPVPKYLC